MRGVAGGARGDAERGKDGVVVDALHEAVDDRCDSVYFVLSRPVSLILYSRAL